MPSSVLGRVGAVGGVACRGCGGHCLGTGSPAVASALLPVRGAGFGFSSEIPGSAFHLATRTSTPSVLSCSMAVSWGSASVISPVIFSHGRTRYGEAVPIFSEEARM